MKNLNKYIIEKLHLNKDVKVNDLKKQAKVLLDEYVKYGEEDAPELLDRAMNLVLSADNLKKNEVSEVEDRYAEIDIKNPDEVEEVLSLVMNLVSKIK